MSSSSQNWDWLLQICLHPPEKNWDNQPFTNWRFCPGKSGEPWVSYEVAANVLGLSTSTIEKKAKLIRKHPAFPGLIRLTDFEDIGNGEET